VAMQPSVKHLWCEPGIRPRIKNVCHKTETVSPDIGVINTPLEKTRWATQKHTVRMSTHI